MKLLKRLLEDKTKREAKASELAVEVSRGSFMKSYCSYPEVGWAPRPRLPKLDFKIA